MITNSELKKQIEADFERRMKLPPVKWKVSKKPKKIYINNKTLAKSLGIEV